MSDYLNIGEMRNHLKAMTKTESKSSSGMLTHTWTQSFCFYAAVNQQKTNEAFSNLLPNARNTVTFSTWMRDDIKRDMRIEYNSLQYNIVALFYGFKTMTIECERVE